MNFTKSLPNSQGRHDFAESTGEPATATFSADYFLPGLSSYSSVGQVNAAPSWTGGPAATTGFFHAPSNYRQLPSYYLDQLIMMDGVTAPVAHPSMAGCHRDMYGQQPFPAPATVSRHPNAQTGGGYSPYNFVAQATVAPDVQASAGASMSVYGANPHLTQAPIAGAFRLYERQPRNLSPTKVQAANTQLTL